jgi:hypothetical protein
VNEREIDEILRDAVSSTPPVRASRLDQVVRSITTTLRPVRPLPSSGALYGGVILICAAVACGIAAWLGFEGIERLSVSERIWIFSALTILTWLAAREFVNEMIPGSRRILTAGTLVLVSSSLLLAVFALLFNDYRTHRFVAAGLICLVTGSLSAIPAGAGCWWVLRRGFAVDRLAAGLAAGLVGGLTGVAVLELHCDNLEVFHVMVWHTSVIPVTVLAGALLVTKLRCARLPCVSREKGA